MKTIDGFSDYYITEDGRVYSTRQSATPKLRKLSITDSGYYHVGLKSEGKLSFQLVHRLVAKTFIPNPDNKPQVNHKDGNKLNNCVSNLEWVTPSGNMQHAYRTGLVILPTEGKGRLFKELSTGFTGYYSDHKKRFSIDGSYFSPKNLGKTKTRGKHKGKCWVEVAS